MRSAGPVRSQPAGFIEVYVRLRGAGAAAPLVELGPYGEDPTPSATGEAGVQATRAGVGDYSLVFPTEKPGALEHVSCAHGHTVPTATTSKIVEFDEDSMAAGPTGLTFRILVVTPATEAVAAAAVDLTSSDVLWITLRFRTIAVNPL